MIGPTTWAQAPSRASTACAASSRAAASESVVDVTITCSATISRGYRLTVAVSASLRLRLRDWTFKSRFLRGLMLKATGKFATGVELEDYAPGS